MQNSEIFYEQMLLIRVVEETLLNLFSQGLLRGTVHTSIGQESCAVGVISAIDKEKDVIISNHRAHGHFIAYCDKVEALIAEVMGKKTGICGGVGGSQHIHYKNMYTNGVQGGIVPCAVGAAFAEKEKKSRSIVVVFLGDGTMGQGTVYEGFNISSVWALPILFILEDNGYAQTTPKHLAHAGSLSSRASSFDIESNFLKVNSPEAVYKVAQKAVNYVRQNTKPFFLHLETYRLSPHSKGDDTRTSDEIESFRRKDPLILLEKKLLPETVNAIKKKVYERVDSAVDKAAHQKEMELEEFTNRTKH